MSFLGDPNAVCRFSSGGWCFAHATMRCQHKCPWCRKYLVRTDGNRLMCNRTSDHVNGQVFYKKEEK